MYASSYDTNENRERPIIEAMLWEGCNLFWKFPSEGLELGDKENGVYAASDWKAQAIRYQSYFGFDRKNSKVYFTKLRVLLTSYNSLSIRRELDQDQVPHLEVLVLSIGVGHLFHALLCL